MSAPRLYEKPVNSNRSFTPLYRGGELYSFYINFDTAITDPDFDDLRLGVFKGDTLVSGDIGPLKKDLVIGIAYNIYCEFLFPITISDGCYNFCIYRHTSGAIMCRSNVITVDNYNYDKSSVLIWRNTYNKFNFNYEDRPGYYSKFRMVLIEVDRQSESDVKQYRSVSDRRLRNSASNLDFFVKIETHKLDVEAHDAMAAIFQHDYININGTKYIAKGPYQIETNLNSPVFNGNIELYEELPEPSLIDYDELPPPPEVFHNEVQVQQFTRNNCPAGQTGSLVTLTANAGDFSSEVSIVEANQLANDHLAAIGQATANEQGVCTLNPFVVIPFMMLEGDYDTFLDNNLLFNIGPNYSAGYFSSTSGEYSLARFGEEVIVQQNYYGGTPDSNGNIVTPWPFPVTCKLQLYMNGVVHPNPAYNLSKNCPANQSAPAGIQSFSFVPQPGNTYSVLCTVEPQ